MIGGELRLCTFPEDGTVTAAEEIRQYVIERYIEPWRSAGRDEITLRLGGVCQETRPSMPLKWVWSALATKRFRDAAGVEPLTPIPPRVHADTCVTFRFVPRRS